MQNKLASKDYAADVQLVLKDVARDYPLMIEFLEYYCGYNQPIQSNNPNEVLYQSGKRDVILTIKSLMRDDVTPEQISKFMKGL